MAGAGTGIVAGMLLVSSSTVFADTDAPIASPYAQNTNLTGMHMMHRWNSATKINALANSLGLDTSTVTSELKSGKNLKQILQENSIVPGQLQKALTSKKGGQKKAWKKS